MARTMAQTTTQIRETILEEIVRRIVAVAHPQQIILFGSAAREQMGPHSDLDLLVVVKETAHRRRLAQAIYRNLIGAGFAADIIVVTADDVRRYAHQPGMVIQPALQEGRIVYAA